MLRPLRRDRRSVRRPGRARFHRDAAAGGRLRAVERTLLAGAAWRRREPQRSADAVAGHKRSVAFELTRYAGARLAVVGRRIVPGAQRASRPMDGRS